MESMMGNAILSVLILSGFMLIRLFLYLRQYLFLKKVLERQMIYVEGVPDEADPEKKKAGKKAGKWIEENQIDIRQTVLKTGIDEPSKSYMEPLGLGHAQKKSIRVLDNLLFTNPEIMGIGRTIVTRAMGYYKNQALKSINPLFWIEFIVFLPKELIRYFGIDDNAKLGSIVAKVLQLIYWIASLFFMYQRYRSGGS